MKKGGEQLMMTGRQEGVSGKSEKACESDGMVVRKEVRYSLRPTNPGNFGFTSVPGGTGQDLGCYVRIWGRSNGPRQERKKACDTALVLVN